MATEIHIERALPRTPVLLGITVLSVVLALAAACGGDEQSQGDPTTTPTQATRTLTPGGTPTVAQRTPTAAAKPTATARPTTVAQATPTAVVVVPNVSVDDSPSWGPDDAPVTIVEFSDFL